MGEGIQQTIKDPLALGLNPKYPKTEFGLVQEMKELAEMLPHLENGTKPWLAITEKIAEKQKEINKLIGKMQREGFTIVPTKMYFKKGKAKVEIAVAKGKKQYDKRATKKNRDWNRDKARYIRKSS